MKIEIVVYKPSGKFYSDCIVEFDEIPLFDQEFKRFVKNHLPARYSEGYVTIRDVDENPKGFHNALFKMEEILSS